MPQKHDLGGQSCLRLERRDHDVENQEVRNAIIRGKHYMIASRRLVDGVFGRHNRSRDDFTVHYEEREVQLSHLTGLDFYISYWREGWVGHTFLSFVFDNVPPVSISIETRPEVGEDSRPLHHSSSSSS